MGLSPHPFGMRRSFCPHLLGLSSLAILVIPFALSGGCAATGSPVPTDDGAGGGAATGGAGGAGGDLGIETGDDSGPVGEAPASCVETAANKSYLGCEFWPTVVANSVWSIFDYAVVVANGGTEPADITVSRKGVVAATARVLANGTSTIYLPWVEELKGPEADACGAARLLSNTVRAEGGAYHLVSSRPVSVVQFNALEYRGEGGPAGKDWSHCPGYTACSSTGGLGCFSFSNDASLLLPSTALTGSYRVMGQRGSAEMGMGSYFAVTGTEDGTHVSVRLSASGEVVGGDGIRGARGGETVSFDLNAGDVVELLGAAGGDLSGSVVEADKAVQVIAGVPCAQAPAGVEACDHVEESVLPAESLGQHYLVTAPSSPRGAVRGHVVRLYGNVDGTVLLYPSGRPKGAPGLINAGEVIDLGRVDTDFEVVGNHAFGVGSVQLGASMADPDAKAPKQMGDPSLSMVVAVEQYRSKYVFLAPGDYEESYAVVTQPLGAQVVLDGEVKGIGSGYGVRRVRLGAGAKGAHVLSASAPVGVQVMGYGAYTSYQAPGGMNLRAIAPPPPR